MLTLARMFARFCFHVSLFCPTCATGLLLCQLCLVIPPHLSFSAGRELQHVRLLELLAVVQAGGTRAMRLVMLLPGLVASLALVPHVPHRGSRAALQAAPPPPEVASASRGQRLMMTAPAEAAELVPESLYPAWPELSPKSDVGDLLSAFAATAAAVPLSASSEPGDGWQRWRDGGFDTYKLIAARLSRQSYPEAAECLRALLATAKKSYPDLYATLKFVPKKNGRVRLTLTLTLTRTLTPNANPNPHSRPNPNPGLNPMIAAMEKGGEPPSLEARTPREARRALEDLTRALEQAWS